MNEKEIQEAKKAYDKLDKYWLKLRNIEKVDLKKLKDELNFIINELPRFKKIDIENILKTFKITWNNQQILLRTLLGVYRIFYKGKWSDVHPVGQTSCAFHKRLVEHHKNLLFDECILIPIPMHEDAIVSINPLILMENQEYDFVENLFNKSVEFAEKRGFIVERDLKDFYYDKICYFKNKKVCRISRRFTKIWGVCITDHTVKKSGKNYIFNSDEEVYRKFSNLASIVKKWG